MNGLKAGDRVDVLKSDAHSRRFCWLPGSVKKLTNLSIHVNLDWDKSTYSFDRKNMHVYPSETMKEHYSWRNELEIASEVDYQDSKSCWVKAKITKKR